MGSSRTISQPKAQQKLPINVLEDKENIKYVCKYIDGKPVIFPDSYEPLDKTI